MEPSAEEIGFTIESLVAKTLREQYRWLNAAAIEDVAARSSATVSECIKAQEPAMRASKDRIGFFSLSAELRNRVYEYSLVTPTDSAGTPAVIRLNSNRGRYKPVYQTPYLAPALLRTCKAVHAEALAILYGGNKFEYRISGLPFAGLVGKVEVKDVPADGKLLGDVGIWLQTIGKENAALVESFEFRIHSDTYWGGDTYDELSSYAGMISVVVSDYVERENIPLPLSTTFIAEDIFSTAVREDERWKRLSIKIGKGGKGDTGALSGEGAAAGGQAAW